MPQGPPTGLLPQILRPVVALIRANVPGVLGLHQVPVTLKSWLWTAADGGNRIDTGVPVPYPDLQVGHYDVNGVLQNTHVEGTAGDPSVTVKWITPAWFAQDGVTQVGGFTVEQLVPSEAPGFEYLYLLGWPQGPRAYCVGPRGVKTEKMLHYTLDLVSVDRRVPF
jgi:hypothetical protein